LGLDGVKLAAVPLAAFVLISSACGGGRPNRLLNGARPSEFAPVDGSVLTQARALPASALGTRLDGCGADFPADAIVVERIGVFAESLTVRSATAIAACDGGIDPAGERRPPWCGSVVGKLVAGRLVDPRLDILCEDREGERLAYAFVTPVAGAHWIAVDQGSYVEIYEALAELPVRVASARRIDVNRSSATFDVTQYDTHGRKLVKGELEAAVAG
jgi:hypothetical protein